MKALLQVAQQQITNDQAHMSQQVMEIDQMEQMAKSHEEAIKQKLRVQQIDYEKQISQLKADHSNVILAIEKKCSEMRRERDSAFYERDFARNEADCAMEENQAKMRRISTLEQLLSEKESLLERIGADTKEMTS